MIFMPVPGVSELREIWQAEAIKEAKAANPLTGYCERVYFVRKDCIRRSGPKKGKIRKYKHHEVELLRFLPSRRYVVVKDLDTKGLDALAEEVLGDRVPPGTNPGQYFLELFRKL